VKKSHVCFLIFASVLMSSCLSFNKNLASVSGLNYKTSFINLPESATEEDITQLMESGTLSTVLTGDFCVIKSINGIELANGNFNISQFKRQRILLEPGTYRIEFALQTIKLLSKKNIKLDKKFYTWTQDVIVENNMYYRPGIDFSKINITNDEIESSNIISLVKVIDGQIFFGDINYKYTLTNQTESHFISNKSLVGIKGGDIIEFSFPQGKTLRTAQLPQEEFHQLVVNKEGNNVIALTRNGLIYVLDLEKWSGETIESNVSEVLDLYISMDYLVVTHMDGNVSILDKNTLASVNSMRIESGSHISVSQNNNYLVFAEGNEISRVDLKNMETEVIDLSDFLAEYKIENGSLINSIDMILLANHIVSEYTISPNGDVLAFSIENKDEEQFNPVFLYSFEEKKAISLWDKINSYDSSNKVLFLEFSENGNYINACIEIESSPYFVIYCVSDSSVIDFTSEVFAGPSGVSFYHSLKSDSRYDMSLDMTASMDNRSILVHGLIPWGDGQEMHVQNYIEIPTKEEILEDLIKTIVP